MTADSKDTDSLAVDFSCGSGQLVTAVVIARDEERVIKRCLDSVEGIVDHRLVYDTGSTDKTMEIAERAGAEVFTDGPWEDFHFADARNRAAELAPTDWILVIDADEILAEGGKWIEAAVRKAEKDGIGCVRFRFEEEKLKDIGPRLYDRRKWSWRFPVHNQIHPIGDDSRMLNALDILIRQLPRGDRDHDVRRWKQTLSLLEKSVEENPDHIDANLHLSGMYSLDGKFEKAISQGEKYVEKAKGKRSPLDISEAWCIMGDAKAMLGDVQGAIESYGTAHKTAKTRREPFWRTAVLLGMSRRYEEGAAFVGRLLSIPAKAKPKHFRFNYDVAWDDRAMRNLLQQLQSDAMLKGEEPKGGGHGR